VDATSWNDYLSKKLPFSAVLKRDVEMSVIDGFDEHFL